MVAASVAEVSLSMTRQVMAPLRSDPVPAEALVPIVVLAVAWIAFCLVDLSRSSVQHLPKWAWAVLIVISVPVGGIAYLALGRRP